MQKARPRILFLAHLLPYPLDGGAKIKSYYTLRALSSAYDVTLLAFVRSEEEKQHVEPLRPLCAGGIETVLIRRSKVRNAADAARALAGRRSFIVQRDWVGAMRTALESHLARGEYAAVHIDHLQMAQYVLPRPKDDPRLILDHHNVESMIIKRLAENSPSAPMRLYAVQEWPKLQQYELEVCRRCDCVLTVTQEDAAILRRLAPDLGNLKAIPIGVDSDYFQPVVRRPGARTLLSIGTLYWPPNVEGLLWFYHSVYPKIRARMPDVRLSIVGAKPVDKIRRLAGADPSVSVPGWVDDVRPTAEECAAFMVPLQSGSGMRVKILNALSMALPVVSTVVGAEGIAVTPSQDILLADTPDAFAEACLRLLRDPVLGSRLGMAGRRLMETRYSWDAVGAQLLGVYEGVLGK